MKIRIAEIFLVLPAMIAVLSLCSCGSSSNAHLSKNVSVSQPPSSACPPSKREPPPEIPIGTVVSSMDNVQLLHLLYDPYRTKYDGNASVLLSEDFFQSGIKKHIFIASLERPGTLSNLQSANVFEFDHGKWLTATNHLSTEQVLFGYTNPVLAFRKIGVDRFGLVALVNESAGAIKSVSLHVYELTKTGWVSAMDVTQASKPGEHVDLSITFKPSSKNHWDAHVKIAVNHDNALVMRYSYLDRQYVPAGFISPKSLEEAMTLPGFPNTDWDSTPTSLSNR